MLGIDGKISAIELFNDENKKAFNHWLNIKHQKPDSKKKANNKDYYYVFLTLITL